MARPSTKARLMEAGCDGFEQLFALIDSMTPSEQEQNFAFEDRDRNLRDVLVHLYEWHQLLLTWINANRAGGKAKFLPEPYNWKTYPQMNIALWGKHQQTPFEESAELLKKSHAQVMTLIRTFSDEALFTRKYFPWTGSTSLGAYCVSATSSHYDWAIKKIGKHKKYCREKE